MLRQRQVVFTLIILATLNDGGFGEPMAELFREFGISRKTGYKIFDRYHSKIRSAQKCYQCSRYVV